MGAAQSRRGESIGPYGCSRVGRAGDGMVASVAGSLVAHVSALPDPILPHYYGLDARLAWRPSRAVEWSVSSRNLLSARHSEFAQPTGEYITRNVLAEAQWRF
jgi:hypothetical protein